MSNMLNQQHVPSDDFMPGDLDLLSPSSQLTSFIKETRKALNISQRELSKLSGLNQSNLSKIENGLIYPSISTIQKLASCLGHKVELHFVPNINK